jgi:hypothetical protein
MQLNFGFIYHRTRMVQICYTFEDTVILYANVRTDLAVVVGNSFTFMLPCIVIDSFLNNQTDALIIQILFCYKTLHVSGIFPTHHREFSTLHSALVSFMQVCDVRFQAESGRYRIPS